MSNPSTHLINYEVSTQPRHLKVTEGAVITIAAKPSVPLFCKQIKVSIPYGSGQGNLFGNQPQVTLIKHSGWRLSTDSTFHVIGSELTLTLKNENPGFTMPKPLVLEISGTINDNIGLAKIMVTDDAGKTAPTAHKEKTELNLEKVTNQFFVKNFVTSSSNQSTDLNTAFNNQQPIYFTWESNGTAFDLYQSGLPTPVYSGPDTHFELKAGIHENTTFVLRSTDHNQGITQTLTSALTLIVNNPDLSPRTSAVHEVFEAYSKLHVRAKGVTIDGPALNVTAPATFSKNVTVQSEAGKPSFTLTQVENLLAKGAFGLYGEATIGQNLLVNRDTTLGEPKTKASNTVTINGNASISGSLTANTGPISIFGTEETLFNSSQIHDNPNFSPVVLYNIPLHTYAIKTDGFLSINIVNPPDIKSVAQDFSWQASVQISAGKKTFQTASFANFISEGLIANLPGNLTVPLKKGENFTFSGVQLIMRDNPQFFNTINIAWIPLGSQTAGESTIELIEKGVETEPQSHHSPEAFQQERADSKETKIDLLVEALENLQSGSGSRETLKQILNSLL